MEEREQSLGFDLSAFLAEQRAQGDQDSEGHFTISREKALSKLAHFALPEEYGWVLKLVQVANMYRAEVLEVVQSRVATSFFFRPENLSDLPTDEKIISELQSGSFNENPVGQLAIALGALVEQAKLSFVLAVRSGSETNKPIYAGDDTSALAPSTREEWTRMSREGVRLTVSHFKGVESVAGRYIPTISRQVRRDIEIFKILERKAYASPTTIRVDNRLITCVTASNLELHDVLYRPLLSGGIDEPTDESPVSQVKTHSIFPKNDVFFKTAFAPGHRGAKFIVCSLEWRAQRALAAGPLPFDGLPLCPYHQVFWLRHGVIVSRRTFFTTTEGTIFNLFVPADSYRSDLTGLSVEFLPEEKENLLSLLSLASQPIQDFAVELPNWPAKLRAADKLKAEQALSALKEKNISAVGNSLVTQSLFSFVPAIKRTVALAMVAINELMQLPGAQKKLINNWTPMVGADLDRLLKDMERSAPNMNL